MFCGAGVDPALPTVAVVPAVVPAAKVVLAAVPAAAAVPPRVSNLSTRENGNLASTPLMQLRARRPRSNRYLPRQNSLFRQTPSLSKKLPTRLMII